MSLLPSLLNKITEKMTQKRIYILYIKKITTKDLKTK